MKSNNSMDVLLFASLSYAVDGLLAVQLCRESRGMDWRVRSRLAAAPSAVSKDYPSLHIFFSLWKVINNEARLSQTKFPSCFGVVFSA